jgi:hypothetical protein
VSGTIDVACDLEHAEGTGSVACPPAREGTYGASEEKEESEDGHGHAKEEKPEREMPAKAYAYVRYEGEMKTGNVSNDSRARAGRVTSKLYGWLYSASPSCTW